MKIDDVPWGRSPWREDMFFSVMEWRVLFECLPTKLPTMTMIKRWARRARGWERQRFNEMKKVALAAWFEKLQYVNSNIFVLNVWLIFTGMAKNIFWCFYRIIADALIETKKKYEKWKKTEFSNSIETNYKVQWANLWAGACVVIRKQFIKQNFEIDSQINCCSNQTLFRLIFFLFVSY